MDDDARAPEPRSFGEARTIDVSDEGALRYWCERLGATAEEIADAVREVGPNVTAVNLKLGAPPVQRAPPSARS